MPNHYPLWKYLLIVAVLVAAAIYALPNIYSSDPAVQISSADGTVDERVRNRLTRLLDDTGLSYKAVEIEESGNVLVRFDRTETQLRAVDAIERDLAGRYTVALNLASATPEWLASLNARPMNLGLDLRGGVYFLLSVDIEAVFEKTMRAYLDDFRAGFRERNIRYNKLAVQDDALLLRFSGDAHRGKAQDYLQQKFPGELIITETVREGDAALRMKLDDRHVKEIIGYAVQQNILTLRKRVDELGVAEPVVTRQGRDRISVQLPGVQDTAQAKEILGATATLEFRMVAESEDPEKARRTRRIPPGTRLYSHRDGTPALLKRSVMLTGDRIIDAASGIDGERGEPAVFITLDGKGARTFARVTADNVKRLMAVVFIENKTETYRDESGEIQKRRQTTEEVISVARIQEQLSKRFQITGLDSTREARRLALLLRAGALAAPLEIVEERTVGPSLGRENIRRGMRSIIFAFLLVVLFMGVYYRVFGLLADCALALNIVLIVAVVSLIPGATLTLPGIVGIVLTVGMAVDANVLIFERIREELRGGASAQASIDSGYRRAFSTIADANVTTLIAALVLFAFGTGPIKGFAVTLSVGILCSMFTAIMGTRAAANLIYGRRKSAVLSI